MSEIIWYKYPHYILYWVVLKKKMSLKKWCDKTYVTLGTYPADHPVFKARKLFERYATPKS